MRNTKKALDAEGIRVLRQMSDLIGGRPCRIAMDRNSLVAIRASDNANVSRLALDKSVRSYDYDGRLHIKQANISKATVNPYIGSEIPNWEGLRLDPKKIYYLYRDPVELEKAAATFNGLPLLKEHEPVTSDDHKPNLVVGSTGTDAEFNHPFLTNSLVIWPEADIKGIETDRKRQLSCGYRYTADMTPGVSPEGDKYDGVMRDIVGNHVALVKEGRAGADVVVGDSKLGAERSRSKTREPYMAKVMTARAATTIRYLVPFIRAKLAQDQSIDMRKLLMGVSAQTWDDDKPRILKGVQKLTRGKLAQDASIGEVAELLDLIDSHGGESGDESVSEAQHNAMEAAAHGKSTLDIPKKVGKEFSEKDKGKSFDEEEEGVGKEHHEKIHHFLKDKLSAEDLDTVHSLLEGKDEAGHEDDEHEDSESERDVGREDPEGERDEREGAVDEEAVEEMPGEDGYDAFEEKGTEEKAGDRKHAKDKRRGAKDEPPPFRGRPRPGGGMDRSKHGMDSSKRFVTRTAMDEAITKARQQERAIADAVRQVRPIVGDLSMSFDSAEAVYAHVLKTKNVKTAGIHPSAFRAMVAMLPKATPNARNNHAFDAKAASSFVERHPDTSRIRVI